MNTINTNIETPIVLSSDIFPNQLLHMTTKEAQRHNIITQAVEKKISEKTAAEKLHLGIRQIQRLKSVFRTEGVTGIIHGLRNKPSNYHSPPKKEVLYNSIHEIIKTDSRYRGCGPTFTLEQLKKDHREIFEKSSCTVATLRTKMTLWNLWKPGKKRVVGEVHRKWREPKETKGEMIQFDGSYHAWLEGRDGVTPYGKPNTCCLLLATDDATGDITQAELTKNEGIECIFPFWKEYSEDPLLGKPYSIYLDKFATYKVNYPTATDTSDVVTQFGRVAKELGISLIFANSPQAKGRVERMNSTLQDRLVKELRFANICTIKEANIYLKEIFIPNFNKQFGKVAKNPKGNLHTPLSLKEKDIENNGHYLNSLFSIHDERKIQNDYTVRYRNKYWQLYFSKGTTLLKQSKVRVEGWLDGSTHVYYRGIEITYREISKHRRERSYEKLKLAPTLPGS